MRLLTLGGPPTIYYGEEIGLQQAEIPSGQVRDPFELNVPGLGLGRDGSRTPMQWEPMLHAGFTTNPSLATAEPFVRPAERRESSRRCDFHLQLAPEIDCTSQVADRLANGKISTRF